MAVNHRNFEMDKRSGRHSNVEVFYAKLHAKRAKMNPFISRSEAIFEATPNLIGALHENVQASGRPPDTDSDLQNSIVVSPRANRDPDNDVLLPNPNLKVFKTSASGNLHEPRLKRRCIFPVKH